MKPTLAAAPIAVTTGEPGGVGPELVLALAGRTDQPAPWQAIGDPGWLRQIARELGSPVQVEPHALSSPGRVGVVPVALGGRARLGTADPRHASYVIETLRTAIDGCLSGRFAAMVTAPLNKASIIEGGFPDFTGHTEFLAERCGVSRSVMLLVAGTLRVALATTHVPLRAVPDALTAAGLEDTLRILLADLARRFGISRPRVSVTGLNPHAGEGGHLGREDQEIIAPVCARLVEEGFAVAGPLPADTAFTPEALAGADAVLAMYHDQGLPVVKHAGFGRAVNVTLGLPIVRTSVDHGTALDIAGRGSADPGSLFAAFDLAVELARQGR